MVYASTYDGRTTDVAETTNESTIAPKRYASSSSTSSHVIDDAIATVTITYDTRTINDHAKITKFRPCHFSYYAFHLGTES